MSFNLPRRRIPLAGSAYPGAEPGQPSPGPASREPQKVQGSTSVYAQATNVTSNAPSGEFDGVATPIGRVWAEARSVTTSDVAASVEVTLTATQKGVRALVRSRVAGTTIAAGSIRFWVQNHISKQWALGGVDETLPTGAQEVATTDQFVTVGS